MQRQAVHDGHVSAVMRRPAICGGAIDANPAPPGLVVAALALNTRMCYSELRLLRWRQQVDLDARTVRVRLMKSAGPLRDFVPHPLLALGVALSPLAH
jgi:hypothetical protein